MKLSSQIRQRPSPDEPAHRHRLVPLLQRRDRLGEVVPLVYHGGVELNRHKPDPMTGPPGEPADALEHGIQDRPGKVRLGVREPGWIVGAGSPAQREVSVTLEVRHERATLPSRAILHEAGGNDTHHVGMFNNELLLLAGELGCPRHAVPPWLECRVQLWSDPP